VPLLRNADRAIIAPEKLRDYLLDPLHIDNRGKARLFAALGYTRANWEQLESDLRTQHLTKEATFGRKTEHGDRYRIVAVLRGPRGSANIRSIWQYDIGSDLPRFISAYQENA
jgi:hypothetical protein